MTALKKAVAQIQGEIRNLKNKLNQDIPTGKRYWQDPEYRGQATSNLLENPLLMYPWSWSP